MIAIIGVILLLLVLTVLLYMQQPKFGKAPSGARLERMKQSPNFKNGVFENKTHTPSLTEGYSMTKVMWEFLFSKNPNQKPHQDIPSVHTDLKHLPADSNIVVWFGHSSYFLQMDGVKFLVDPVFSGNASPVPGSTKAFKGSDAYTVADLPEIDYLLISHDHYDHLDYETIKALKGKVKKVVCGLGVGAHFEYWGYATDKIIERDWEETIPLEHGMKLHTLSSRHFSGRTFKRNNTLWLSFLLETPKVKIFLGGDGGYDDRFKAIGQRFGAIDLAILENGQYNVAWQAIHCLPEETLKAAKELNAKRIMPVHSGKFSLALHDWNEPLREISRLNAGQIPLVTPRIGEPVHLGDTAQVFTEWWNELDVK
ncbi:MBL fold metallo-hydrolase [Edaphocola aurantiacus]|uniref:MBL fold metallo-hydrolase n=1 Tax=Edaphocola aurantiacus TaxID=2601682 RepID=UPI001FEA8B91|nr:MBL fold metallo-hydrolase [Edaphocola aurantiacus]